MRWPWLGLSLLLVLFAGPAHALDLPELAARTKPSVMLLTLTDTAGKKLGSGTGFFVSADGRVITDYHVIRGASGVTATLSDGREIKILGVLAFDEDRDIAILKADGGPFPALSFGDSATIRPGDEVVVIGSPLGLSGTVSAGIVSAVREKGVAEDDPAPRPHLDEDEGEPKLQSWGIQITAAISPGSSGSPIMTRGGDVIAVAVGTRLDGQALNFGVPIQVVKNLLDGIDAQAAPKSFAVVAKEASKPRPGEVLKNLEISAAGFTGVALVYFVVSRILAALARRRTARERRRAR